MKKYCLFFLLLLSACAHSTSEYGDDLQGNKVYKMSCTGFCSLSDMVKMTKKMCSNQTKLAKGYNAQYQFAEVLFTCKDEIEVQ